MSRQFHITVMFVVATLFAIPSISAASAQGAAANYSYKAPSGMFSEGTTKWQMYQFMASDQEKRSQANGERDVSTGSISNSSSNDQSYPRPRERTRGFGRSTAR